MSEFDVVTAYVDEVCRNCGHTAHEHFPAEELGFGETLAETAERMRSFCCNGDVEDCWVETCFCAQFVPSGVIHYARFRSDQVAAPFNRRGKEAHHANHRRST